jgi:hypothetical protein
MSSLGGWGSPYSRAAPYREASEIVTTAHIRQPSRAGIGELSKIEREEGILYLSADLYELLPNYSS